MSKQDRFDGLKPNPRVVQSRNPFAAMKGAALQPAPCISKDPRELSASHSSASKHARQWLAIQHHDQAVRKAVQKMAGLAKVTTTPPSSTRMSTGQPYKWAGDSTTPYGTLYDWLTGSGPTVRVFRDRDAFTGLLKEHHHLEAVREKIVFLIRSNRDASDDGTNRYGLDGLKAIPYFLIDVDNVLHGGSKYNPAMTFLGGFGLNYEIVYINKYTRTAEVRFHVWNRSSIESASRPPWLSTTDWWGHNIRPTLVPWLEKTFAKGPLSDRYQDFYWTEAITW